MRINVRYSSYYNTQWIEDWEKQKQRKDELASPGLEPETFSVLD